MRHKPRKAYQQVSAGVTVAENRQAENDAIAISASTKSLDETQASWTAIVNASKRRKSMIEQMTRPQ